MTEKTAPLRATLKSGTGYDAPWLTVDANTPEELEQRLRAIMAGGALEAVAEAAGQFRATQLTVPPAQHSPSAPQQQAAPQQGGGWSQPPQQQAAPQRQSGGFAPTHPEGKTCDACGQVLEVKITGSGKKVFRCPEWRWNNGNPNEHTQEWAN